MRNWNSWLTCLLVPLTRLRLDMSRKRTSSGRWLDRQRRDPFVKQAKESGWRSRAVYKLEQIDKRDRLIRPGMCIVDLGCAPGGWSQYALKRLAGKGRVLGLDLLEIDPLPGLQFYQGDFLSEDAMDWIASELGKDGRVDLVLSDMAPNMSGNRLRDQALSIELLQNATMFCSQRLKVGGDFLFKAFHGEDLPELVESLNDQFESVQWRKPGASRQESREVFVLARGHRMKDNGIQHSSE